jgi:hypothetical protein
MHIIYLFYTDGQVFPLTNKQMICFHLCGEQMVNGLKKKISGLPFSVFPLKWQYIYICVYVYVYVYVNVYINTYTSIYKICIYIHIYIWKYIYICAVSKRLMDLRKKIPGLPFSVFPLKWQYIYMYMRVCICLCLCKYIYKYIYEYIYIKKIYIWKRD